MKKASILMVLGSLLLLALYIFPLWKIILGAPQYPDPLGINIHINGLSGVSEFDIQNIDGLNHYIGMQKLPKPEDMWEFSTFPLIVGILIALGILIGILGFLKKLSYKWFILWLILTSVLGALGIYDFNTWLVDYGTHLNPRAIIKLLNEDGTPMTYKPPLFGHIKMLNFDVTSLPEKGCWIMILGMLLVVVASFLGLKSTKPAKKQ